MRGLIKMAENDSEKTKARRAEIIIYTVMAVFVILPVILFLFFR